MTTIIFCIFALLILALAITVLIYVGYVIGKNKAYKERNCEECFLRKEK